MGAMDDSDESNNAITIISNESEVGIDASALLSQVLIVVYQGRIVVASA